MLSEFEIRPCSGNSYEIITIGTDKYLVPIFEIETEWKKTKEDAKKNLYFNIDVQCRHNLSARQTEATTKICFKSNDFYEKYNDEFRAKTRIGIICY